MPELLFTNHQQTIKSKIAPLKRTLEGLNLLVVRILNLITGCLICVTHFPHRATRLCITQTAERSSALCHGSTVSVTVIRTQTETLRPEKQRQTLFMHSHIWFFYKRLQRYKSYMLHVPV